MSVGGIDVLLRAPAQEDLGDMILRACRRHWKGERCFFQDANDEANAYPLDDPWVWTHGTASKEFFVYRNEAAWRSWDADGLTAKNANTMLHFIIGFPEPSNPSVVEVCMVCDRLTAEVKRLIANLEATFLGGVFRREAA